ncbi:MAG: LysR family transcriptional regulator [Desulfurococcales archaeon]|nr:LysR family transcriptional regulator [Desulfurococcales archaeon]
MLRPRVKLVLEKDGIEVVDEDLALILELVEKMGSILAASREAGIPYSRAWEKIVRAERILGSRLVETRRGGRRGGGARLTPQAKQLLAEYKKASKILGISPRPPGSPSIDSAFVAYSSDPLLETALSHTPGVDGACIGSSRSLAMLSLGEADVACIHLYDPNTGLYNKPYLEHYQVEEPLIIGGYLRELVLAYHPRHPVQSVEEAIRLVVEGKLSMASRPPGAGTRLYQKILVKQVLGNEPIGWPNKYTKVTGWTHEDTARSVARGEADITITLRYAAEKYKIPYIHLSWEKYECYTTTTRNKGVEELANILNSQWFTTLLQTTPGYKPQQNKQPNR